MLEALPEILPEIDETDLGRVIMLRERKECGEIVYTPYLVALDAEGRLALAWREPATIEITCLSLHLNTPTFQREVFEGRMVYAFEREPSKQYLFPEVPWA